MQSHNSKFGPAVSVQMQTRLVDVWAENCVPEFYESLFLQFLKRLPAEEAEITMQEEIRSIRKGSGYIQLFMKTMREKAKLEQFIAPGTPEEPDLPRLCECVGKLRELNFKATHFLHKIRGKYDEPQKASSERYFFHRFATRLENFRKALLKSKLSRVVSWQGEYDPFFMALKTQGQATQEEAQALEDLFAMPVDQSYRFLKMRKVLVSWIYLDPSYSEKRPPSPPLEDRYFSFPSIKNQLIRERSEELQKLKTIPVQREDYIYKRSHFYTDSDVDLREKDANRTKYFLPREPQLLGRSIQESHFGILASTPFQLPGRNERKSEDVGRIRRSRISQLNNNVLSRAARPRYADSMGKCTEQRLKLDRLTTPQKSSRKQDDQASGYSTPSRKLTKSLLINIMISPLKPPAAKQFEAKLDPPKEVISSNITEKPTQPRRLAVQSVDLGQPNASSLEKKAQLERSLFNLSQAKPRSDPINPINNELTKRNNVLSTAEVRDPNDVRSTLVMGKEERVPSNANQLNTGEIIQGKQKINKLSSNNSNTYNNNSVIQNAGQQAKMPTYPQKNEPNRQPLPKNEPIKQENYLQPKPAPPLKTEQAEQDSKLINEPMKQPSYSKTQVIKQAPKANQFSPEKLAISERPAIQSNSINSYINSNPNNTVLKNTESIIPLTVSGNDNSKPTTNIYPNASSTNPTSNPPPFSSELKASTVAAGKQEKRQIKIKIGKMNYKGLVEYLSAYTAHPRYSNTYDLKKILKETEFQQSYLIQFLINDQPGALALSSLVPPVNNFAIRLWLIHSSADPSLSSLLFRKYIQLVEKCITAQLIYFKGEEMPELTDAGFQFKKEKLYARQRTSKPKEIDREFQPFLNCQCSHVSFPQRQKEDILFSQEIEKFDSKNSLSAEFLFNMQGLSGPLANMLKVDRGLGSFVQVNKLLEQEDLDEYEVNKSITASPIDLLRLAFQSTIKDPFTACQGVFKFFGFEIFSDSQRILSFVNLSKNNGKLYFGQGFQTIQQFSMSLTAGSGKRGNFCVPMFTKSLYGRYEKIHEKDRGFYGNWDMSLVWEDEMQGRVKHSTDNSASFTCPFLVGLEVEGSLLYCLQVCKDDLVY